MTERRHSRRLREKIEPALPELVAATSSVVAHPRFRDLYVDFAVTVHEMIRASVPLMRAAHRRCLELAEGDPVAAAAATYLTRHIPEEMHHDDWLLEDLERLGVPRATVLARMPGSAVASMIGAHYYWIHHRHPIAQLGQIAAMEGYPSGIQLIDSMVERTGFPREVFRTLEMHCHLDPRHRDAFDEALDAMPLTEEHHEILEVSAVHTVRMAAATYRGILRRASMPAARAELEVTPSCEDGDWRLEDSVRGAVFRIGEQESFLLSRCDGRQSRDEACLAFRDRFGEPLTRADLDEFLSVARAEHWLAEDGTD